MTSFRGGYRTLLVAGLVFLGLYAVAQANYPLFHTLAEMFAIVVAFSTFMLAWNAGRFMENSYLLFLGVAYFFVASIDLAHALAYKGVNVFNHEGSNLATQLWVGARYVEASSVVAAPFFLGRRLKVPLVFSAFCIVTVGLLLSIFYWHVFPNCFEEDIGLTQFKKSSEYLISLLLAIAVVLLVRKREQFESRVLWLLIASLLLTIASELSFTLYEDAYGFPNQLGHFLKLVSFYLIYKAILQTCIVKPYVALVDEIKEREHLEKAILDISEREQRRIGQELHDSIGQLLAGIALMIKVLEQKLSTRGIDEASYAQKIASLVDKTTNQTRHLAKGLSPMDLDTGSLASALEELAANTEDFGVRCTFSCAEPGKLDEVVVAKNVYRIAQEAIANAIKHGKCSKIDLELVYGEKSSKLTVESDGFDFPDGKVSSAGMGLSIMEYRARVIGGAVEVRRGSAGGTLVICDFPCGR